MKMNEALHPTFAVLAPNTYLVLRVEGEVVEYCATMAERNEIPGLLPVHRQMVDGEVHFYYDISRRRRFGELARQGRLNRKQAERLLSSLLESFRQLPEYFLHPGMCFLESEYLFVDDGFRAGLALVPLFAAPEQSGEELKHFFLQVLGACVTPDRSEPYFDQLVRYLLQPEFHLEEFERLVLPERQEEKPLPSPEQVRQVSPQADSAKAGKSRCQEGPAPKSAGMTDVVIPGIGGVAIPGVQTKSKGEKPPKPENGMRKEGGVFGFHFGGGKKANKRQDLDMGKESHMISACVGEVPVPPMISRAAMEEEQWQGTVNYEEEDECTVMQESARNVGPTLVYEGRHVALTGAEFTLGKRGSSFVLSSPKVSRTHAVILEKNGTYYIKDENSTNHTFVDGVMLAPYTLYPLKDKSVISLADEKLIFERGNQP